MPKVSFIVPFWGVEKYIAECIESILSQTFNDFELLLIDDCSQDESRAIAEKYARNDARIRIITHESNTGQGGGRNTGLTQAKGNYIWYIDSDDFILNDNALETIHACAIKYEVDVLLFDSIRDKNGKREYMPSAEPMYAGLFDSKSSVERFVIQNLKKIHFVWNKFFKKSFLIQNGCYFLEKTNHQDSIQILWVFNARKIFYSPQAFYLYRLRDQSTMTAKKNARSYEHVCKMSVAYENYFFNSMEDSRNSRVLTLAKKIYFLLFAGASARCYIDSSQEDKVNITDMAMRNFKESNLYNKMPQIEVQEVFNNFKEVKYLIQFESALRNNNETKAKYILNKILKNKHGISVEKVISRIKTLF